MSVSRRSVVHLYGVVIAAAVMLLVPATSMAVSPRDTFCSVSVGTKPMGPIVRMCDSFAKYAFARLHGSVENNNPAPALAPGARSFRGWARVIPTDHCSYDRDGHPMMCPGAPDDVLSSRPTIWLYTEAGWRRSNLPIGSWVQAQYLGGTWFWAHASGRWYAVRAGNLEAYCGFNDTKYSNCQLQIAMA